MRDNRKTPSEYLETRDKAFYQAINSTRAWKYLAITKDDAILLASNMVGHFKKHPEADNLWNYLLTKYHYAPSQYYDMAELCPELKAAIEICNGLISARAQEGWKDAERDYFKTLFKMHSPDLVRRDKEDKNQIKEDSKIVVDTLMEKLLEAKKILA